MGSDVFPWDGYVGKAGEGTSGGDKDERFVTGFGETSQRGV